MTSPNLRIALLECDTPSPEILGKYGNYGDIFRSLLETAASNFDGGLKISLSAFDVVATQQYPRLENIDAILVSGSKYNSFDNDPWIKKLVAFVQTVLAQSRVRIIGVCFGHQIVGRALAGDDVVGRNDAGWELSVTDLEVTQKGREVFGTSSLVSFTSSEFPEYLMIQSRIELIVFWQAIHQMHQDIVYHLPEGVELLASTSNCQVQGMYIYKKILTVQGHPEFNDEIVRIMLRLRHNSGVLDDETYSDAMDRVKEHHDGIVIAKAFLKFILE